MQNPDPDRGAIVLAGGGELGIAWQSGLVAGLLEERVDLRSAKTIVGTSAGSVVGSRLAGGVDMREVADRLAARAGDSAPSTAGPLEAQHPAATPEALALAFGRLLERFAAGEAEGQSSAELGAFARTASEIPEEIFRDTLAARLRIDGDFPASLRVATIDTASGDLVVLDHASGMPLAHAVAASCSIPGIFPPITTPDGRRLMDGGVRSVTNADVILDNDPGHALIVDTLFEGAPEGTLFHTWLRRTGREIAQLREAGFEPILIRASSEDHMAMGFNPMDSSKAPAACEAGRARGRREAACAAFDPWRT